MSIFFVRHVQYQYTDNKKIYKKSSLQPRLEYWYFSAFLQNDLVIKCFIVQLIHSII